MTRFLVSFDDGAMAHVTGAELAAASVDSHAVLADAKAAGVYIHGGGVQHNDATSVAPDGSVTPRPHPEAKAVVGGFVILDVESRDEAHAWAARFAAACRCAQDVRELMHDPEAYA